MSTNNVNNTSFIQGIRSDLAGVKPTDSRVKEAPLSFPKLYSDPTFKLHAGVTKTLSTKQRKVFNVGTTVPKDAEKNVEAIHDKLVERTGSIANVFVKNAKSINKEFEAQLNVLDAMIKKLEGASKDFSKKEVGKALAEINGFLCRFNNSCVGGIDKSSGKAGNIEYKDQLKHLSFTEKDTADAEKTQKAIENITREIKELNDSGQQFSKERKSVAELQQDRKDLQKTLGKFSEKARLDPNTIKKNFEILKQNVNTLRKYAGENPKTPGTKLEQGLNLIQKTCLSAWMFNDIREAVDKVITEKGKPSEALKLFPPKNKKMLRLNQEARSTEMFQEVKLEKLLGGEEKLEKLKKKHSGNEAMLKFLKSDPKFGHRGRLGFEKTQNMVEEEQIANGGSAEDVEQRGKLYESEKNAVFSTFTPPKTANLKTIKDSDVETLNGFLTGNDKDCKETAKEIAKALVEKGLANWKKDGGIEAKPSYTDVINRSGLSSHCGPSGTTGEILSVLRHSLDEAGTSKMKNAFKQIREIANTGECPKDFDCSDTLSMVALFMEIGDFHTTSEAIGGLYSVAVADHNVELQDQKDIADRYDLIMSSGHHLETDKAENTSQNGYTNLLNVFKSNMSAFLEPKNAIA